jgi:hypothetical protein
MDASTSMERGAVYWHVQPVERKPDGEKLSKKEAEEIREADQPRIKNLLNKCGSMGPAGFMYLIPEAFLLCRGQLDAGYFSGKRSVAEMSEKELNMVRRRAFGRSKRLAILYTFDVDEAFRWFRKHRSEEAVQEELQSRLFKEIGADMKVVERWSEKERKPRIYQQHLEHPLKFYLPRKEVDAATRDKFDRSWEKIRRQDEERARRSRN